MVNKILFGSTLVLSMFLLLFLNGNVSIPDNPLPPMGKFLNPFGGVWSSDTRSEKNNITLSSEKLKGNVEIIFDERRVPHIFAENMEDALFAQGYVEAQNRLFQMQFIARAAAGELSEVMGERTLEYDKAQRRKGMKHAAENAIKGWEKTKDFQLVHKYIDGVNAYLENLKKEDYPFEFKLLDASPETWDALKSALVFKYMAQTLAGGTSDVAYSNLINTLGKDDFNMLYPERQTVENPIVPTEKPYKFDTIYGKDNAPQGFYDKPILKSYFEAPKKGIGSNSWGVSGQKSTTGAPIFCNDPHLSLGLPSIWFEVHICTPEFNSYGVSVPGLPGIMIGFNEHVAWGETNVGQDVLDIFHIQWTDATRSKYILDGQEKTPELRIEEINVKGAKSVYDTVQYTYWGPILHKSNDGTQDLAMRWLCHDSFEKSEFTVFVNTMKSKNYADFLVATEPYNSPAQNFGFACVDGDIALRVNGLFPAKHDQDGRFVEYGNSSANNWQKWIPKSQIPHIVNPERGFISSANQVSADKTYPYYFNGRFERYRNRIINDKLTNTDKFSPEDMQKMQLNAVSYKAQDFITMLKKSLDVQKLNAAEKKLFEILEDWDYAYAASSEAPVVFDLFCKSLEKNTWDEIDTLKATMDVRLPEDWRLLELIQNDPQNKYFDHKSTPIVEDASDIVLKSFRDACVEFAKKKTENKSKWAAYRGLNIYHLTRVPALSEMDVVSDGCGDAINATSAAHGPSWRMVVSMEKEVKAHGIYPGGQSGNPCSKFYKNMIDPWSKGNYYALKFIKKPSDLKAGDITQKMSLEKKSI